MTIQTSLNKNLIYEKYCITLIISVLALFINIAPCHAIKIGLEENIKQTYVGTSKAGQIVDGRSKKPLYYTKALVPYTIKAHNDTLVIKINGKYYNCLCRIRLCYPLHLQI